MFGSHQIFSLDRVLIFVFFYAVMETVELVDHQKKAYIKALEEFPHDHVAAKAAKVPISMVRRWFDEDPDFNLACTEIKEVVIDSLEQKALKLAIEGSEVMLKYTLTALRPDVWNPTQKVEHDVVGHRFIDFTGESLHGDVDEIEDQQSDNDAEGRSSIQRDDRLLTVGGGE